MKSAVTVKIQIWSWIVWYRICRVAHRKTRNRYNSNLEFFCGVSFKNCLGEFQIHKRLQGKMFQIFSI